MIEMLNLLLKSMFTEGYSIKKTEGNEGQVILTHSSGDKLTFTEIDETSISVSYQSGGFEFGQVTPFSKLNLFLGWFKGITIGRGYTGFRST